jgi:uncharacterized tellurite resistance protein B-like protein
MSDVKQAEVVQEVAVAATTERRSAKSYHQEWQQQMHTTHGSACFTLAQFSSRFEEAEKKLSRATAVFKSDMEADERCSVLHMLWESHIIKRQEKQFARKRARGSDDYNDE